MIDLLAAQAHRPRPRDRLAVAQGQLARMVVPQFVPARLGAEPHDEGGIPVDVDALDRVHLDGNAQGHGAVFQAKALRSYVCATATASSYLIAIDSMRSDIDGF